MPNIFLVNYKVQGIKNLDSMISLSFYKKTIRKPIDTQDYNIKGIYGMNGSGKSAIIMSIDILRNLLIHEDYLNNPIVQKSLNELINKQKNELYIEAEILYYKSEYNAFICNYIVELKKKNGKYEIDREKLSYKMTSSKKDEFNTLLEVKNGKITDINLDKESEFKSFIVEKTMNLLSKSTFLSLYLKNSSDSLNFEEDKASVLFNMNLSSVIIFGARIHVFMESSDNHTDYFLKKNIGYSGEFDEIDLSYQLLKSSLQINKKLLDIFSNDENFISKDDYEKFVNRVKRLEKFIQIFKPDLTKIDIEKKENGDYYVCSLNMVYGTYSINTEFESTGIKKLIQLFAYLQAMVQGGIVFIDEFDSNLHDVYLCALIEYLMEYGKGQLCFTTHNVGPMDILKSHKKSIDFLSLDHKIYSWKKNGNYSPSKLYRNGMIIGSPFNVDSIDFIGIFDESKEEEE